MIRKPEFPGSSFERRFSFPHALGNAEFWAIATPITGVLLLLGSNYFVAPRLAAVALAAIAWVFLFGAVLLGPGSMSSFAAASATGVSGAVLFAVSPEQWFYVGVAVAFRLAFLRAARREALALATVYVVPAALLAVSVLGDLPDSRSAIVDVLRYAVFPLASSLLHSAVIACAIWALGGVLGERALPRRGAAFVATAIATATCGGVLVVRARATLGDVLLPTDARQWSEPPLLMNILKFRQHVPIFGAYSDVNSFTYSPTFELLQATLLSPFHASLHIVAHRRLVLVWQVATALVLALAISPRLGRARRITGIARVAIVAGAVLCLEWSSVASPFLHPDHAVHAIVAAAVLVLLGSDRTDGWTVPLAFAFLPVLGALFKLTGAGIGLGLGLVALVERRPKWLGSLAVALALILLSIPLYDSLFGRFSDYAISLMSRHPVNWSRILDAMNAPAGRIVLVACAVGAGYFRDPKIGRVATRLALFAAGLAIVTGLGFLKEGGRANNLIAPALPALALVIVVLASRRSGFADVACAAAFGAVIAGPLPEFLPERLEAARADHRVAVAFVKNEIRAGHNPLVHSGTTTWIEAGGRGVPRDQLHPAIELFLARDPAFRTHLARLAAGTYGSIVTPGETFFARTTDGTDLGAVMRNAVEEKYCVVYPTDSAGRPVTLTGAAGRVVILRRRDLGCALPPEPERP